MDKNHSVVNHKTLYLIFHFRVGGRMLHNDSTYIMYGCIALKSTFSGNRLNRDTETEGKYRPIETREPQKLTESNPSRRRVP